MEKKQCNFALNKKLNYCNNTENTVNNVLHTNKFLRPFVKTILQLHNKFCQHVEKLHHTFSSESKVSLLCNLHVLFLHSNSFQKKNYERNFFNELANLLR
jgi:hypothetical protein